MKRALHLVLALTMTSMLSSCYGPFNLTRKIHKWNGEVGQHWVNEFVFLSFAVLPVYVGAVLADAVVFNTLEFWTGKNPVNAKNIKSIQNGDDQAVLNYDPSLRRLRVDSFKRGRLAATLILEPGPAGDMVARDSQGNLLMSALTQNDAIVLMDASGRQIARYNSSQMHDMLAKRN